MKSLTIENVHTELLRITKQILIESGEPHKRDININDSLQHLGIDSLARAELFARIEKDFAVTLPDTLLTQVDTLADVAQYLVSPLATLAQNKASKTIINHDDHPRVDPSNAQTLVDLLWLYGDLAKDKTHIYFYNEAGSEEIITYGMLLQQSLQVAASLRQLGLREGETVAIMQPTHPGFFYTFFGTLLAGGIPVPIYPPFRMHMLESYAKLEAKILQSAQVRILVTFEQAERLSILLKGFVPCLKHVVTVNNLLSPVSSIVPSKLITDNYAFIQYTSGSTNDPKGVLLTHANLLANIRAYGKAIKIVPTDVTVSWLPLYHDLGLIGMWLGSLYHGIPLVLMTPFSFLNHPERWLWTIHYHRATISGAPNFAYELCIRKITPQQIEGLDLSSWRLAANGAEKVYPNTLEAFAKKFAPYHFNQKALYPVYGLAESTVGLALPEPGKGYTIDYIDREQFALQKIATPSQAKDANSFVSCGKPIPGHEIKIVDDQGKVLSERHVGRLWFRGPSNMQGYYNNPTATAAIMHEGWIDSGDLAYIAEGEIYITGRYKDLIIKAGKNLYPAEIEEFVSAVSGIRSGCTVAFGDHDVERGTEQLIIVAETREKDKAHRAKLRDAIKQTISEHMDVVPDQVILVAPHVIPKTSSGKLQRAATKKLYQHQQLGHVQLPAWLQVVRLGVRWFWQRSLSVVSYIAKLIYTIYVAGWVILTMPLLYLLIQLMSRDQAAWACKYWAKLMMAVAFCPITLRHQTNLKNDTPMIYVANHASYLDPVVLLCVLPTNTRIVGKKEIFTTPFLKTFANKLDYLPVDRMDLTKGVEDTKRIEDRLKQGCPILIFPEGTFGYAEGLRPFRLGAFKVACEAQAAICPIALKGVRYLLRDDEKLMQPKHITITVCPPLLSQGKEWSDMAALKNTARAAIAEHCGETSLDLIASTIVAPNLKAP